jgi:hypothetical protein
MTNTVKKPHRKSERYARMLNDKFKGETKFSPCVFTVERGRRFDRITQETRDGRNRSVHCFVEVATGHIYKAAGYKAPAPHVRYASPEEAIVKADLHGSYLYLK